MRKLCSALLVAAGLGGCADYQFTVNDRVVYTPEPLFSDYQIPDLALQECVQQHVRDAAVKAAVELTLLNCSHAGVTDLSGLEIFTGLTHLKLSNNSISKLAPIATMAVLQELYLDGNEVRSIMPLRGLNELSVLALQGNTALTCQQLAYFAQLPDLELEPPEHCAA